MTQLIRKNLWHMLLMCIIVATGSSALTGCQDGELPFLDVSTEYIDLSGEKTRETVNIKSHGNWFATSDADWCKLLNPKGSMSGSFIIAPDANETTSDRFANITITSSGADVSSTILVRQGGEDALLTVSVSELKFYKNADTYKVSINSNCSWTIDSSSEWCKVSKASGLRNDTFTIVVDPNQTSIRRVAQVIISTGEGKSTASRTIDVEQSAADATISVSPKEILIGGGTEDVSLTILSSSDWKCSSNSSWLTLSSESGSGDATVTVTAKDNQSGGDRVGSISVFSTIGADREIHTVTVTQTADKYYLEVPITEFTLNKDAQALDVKYLLAGKNCEIELSNSADWIQYVILGDKIELTILENTGDKARVANIGINTKGQSGAPITRPIVITQLATDNILEVLLNDVVANPLGGEIKIPFTSSDAITLRSSSEEWLSAVALGPDIVVTTKLNASGSDREGVITVELTTSGGKTLSKSFIVKQKHANVVFGFTNASETFVYNGETRSLALTATGKWELTTDLTDSWVSLSSKGGTGSAVINVTAATNKTIAPRSFDLAFKNLLTEQLFVLTIVQGKSPESVVGDYKYLGKGYDASGEYAVDSWVKAQVLDWKSLEAAGCIADALSLNSTHESTIYGSTREEYQESMSVEAKISAKGWGFSASVSSSFSSNSYTSSDNSFATHRHITLKQSIKLHENLTATKLRDHLTAEARADIDNIDLPPADIIKKYGTHVVAGFVLGGSLDYSMSAFSNSSFNAARWGAAAKAGFSAFGFGGSVEASYDDYQSLKSENENFEESLVARGGDSQYASGKGDATSFKEWLKSLSEPAKWAMVDFDGSGLISIAEFAANDSRKTDIKNAIEEYLKVQYNTILGAESSSMGTLTLATESLHNQSSNTSNIVGLKIVCAYGKGDKIIFNRQDFAVVPGNIFSLTTMHNGTMTPLFIFPKRIRTNSNQAITFAITITFANGVSKTDRFKLQYDHLNESREWRFELLGHTPTPLIIDIPTSDNPTKNYVLISSMDQRSNQVTDYLSFDCRLTWDKGATAP